MSELKMSDKTLSQSKQMNRHNVIQCSFKIQTKEEEIKVEAYTQLLLNPQRLERQINRILRILEHISRFCGKQTYKRKPNKQKTGWVYVIFFQTEKSLEQFLVRKH